MSAKPERFAPLKEGCRYLIRYRNPKPRRGYSKPVLVEVRGGKVYSVIIEERLLPGMGPRLDLGDRYRKVRSHD